MEDDNLNTRLQNFEQELINYVRSLCLINEEQDLVQEIFLKEIESSSKIRLMNLY
jgi:DNA-directed RNA polymerase specialized sigma24 family protein